MTRQMTAALTLAFALALARPALAQEPPEGGGAEKCMGGPEGSKCGGGAPGGAVAPGEHDLRVKFDKDDAKGEIMCKKGKLRNGKVVFAKCAHDKLDKYEGVAVRKKIVSKEKFDKLDARKKLLAKKLAFYDSARKKILAELKELGEEKRDDIEYKKLEGAQAKIDKEFDKSLSDCAKEDKADFACPSKD